MSIDEITCSAPINIAVIKYWGKRDENLILPTNSSVSCTISQELINTKTTIQLSSNFKKDRMWLNGKEEEIKINSRLYNLINNVKDLRKIMEGNLELKKMSKLNLHICSKNNFPTAAGLASSASGYSCLAYGLCKLYELNLHDSEISRISRMASGSACRSIFGGYVTWEMGNSKDGNDSIAKQIKNENHWPDLQALILVVKDEQKDVSSSNGMQKTVNNSTLFKHRIDNIVEERVKLMEKYIIDKNFEEFAKLTMQDSNQFHSVCLDTYPPIFYLNDTSKNIINLITKYNEIKGKVTAAYTFDAGPNAVIYCLKNHCLEILKLILKVFGQNVTLESHKDAGNVLDYEITDENVIALSENMKFSQVDLKKIIHTNIGEGVKILNNSDTLLDKDGLPLNI